MPELVRESFAFSGGDVDLTGVYPVIRGALICGAVSEHGYRYPKETWTPQTLKKYEGAPSFEGHRDGSRLPSEKIGWWENIRIRESDGLPVGDYHLEPSHPLTERLVRAAQKGGNPRLYAMSHVASVNFGTRNGEKVVESIGTVHSIDVVSKGGTTGGIFESGKPIQGKAMKVKEFTKALAGKLDVGQLLKLHTVMKPGFVREDGYSDADMMPGSPDPAAADTGADKGMDTAFLSLCTKECQDCIDAKGDPAKVKSCLARLKKILMTHGELSTDDVKDEPEGGDAKKKEEETKKAEEAAKATAAAKPKENDPWQLIAECKSEQFTPSATQLTALKGMLVKEERTAFIREQKGLQAATQPRSVSRDQLADGDKKKGTVKEDGTDGAAQTGIEQAAARARGYAAEFQGVTLPK